MNGAASAPVKPVETVERPGTSSRIEATLVVTRIAPEIRVKIDWPPALAIWQANCVPRMPILPTGVSICTASWFSLPISPVTATNTPCSSEKCAAPE